ncbi:MAG TPA: FlgD immunoglobulin-like domain containing protein, partial [Candidatus Syntrophosphaera sp.]|nr:FlgD immunoglobulin-like domain containing protein [Candidatus Syntrophosphaera sp.]
PVIASLGMNSQRQIITVTQNGSLIVLNTDNTPYPNFPVSLSGACLGAPAIADLNGDCTHEILVATLNGNLHAINSATGQNIAGFPIAMIGGSQNPITVANLDSDTSPEIVVTTSTAGYILGYNSDASVLFQKNVGGQIKSGAVVADVNNDGTKEIVVTGATGLVHILTPAGNNLPNTPINIGQATDCTPTVARFDGDNYAGIIFGDTNGKLHSVRADGTESPNFPITLGGNIKISAALADIDQDNDFDIAIPNDAGYYVIDIKRPAQSIEWGCFMGTYNRGGNIYQATPNQDQSVPAPTTRLEANFPNPFNPSTMICFELAAPGNVTLDIYNQKGQLVRTLVDSDLPAGRHQIEWNGKDSNGNNAASGLYFYRMHSGSYSSTRKMVLMK